MTETDKQAMHEQLTAEERNVGVNSYVSEPFDADFRGRLKMGVLGNYCLNSANAHADSHGFGIDYLNANNFTWVLSRMTFEIDQMPQEHEHFTIETWVETVRHYFTKRNFAIQGDNRKVYGYATSIWAMIDVNTRQPADLLSLHEGSLPSCVVEGKPCPVNSFPRGKQMPGTLQETLDIKYGDIDINGHMNSVRYIEHILDLFPLERYQNQHIARFEIAYSAECFYGDKLCFYLAESTPNEYQVDIRRSDEGSTCKAKILFTDN